MTMTAKQRRFVAYSDADPGGYAEDVRNYTGHSPAVTEALFAAHRHLHHGNALTADHVQLLQRAHPHIPAQGVAAMCRELNKQAPGPYRASLFLGLLSGDLAAVGGRFNEAGDAYRQTSELARSYHLYDTVAELNRRRDGGKVKPEPVERPTDPLSTRAIIESQLYPRGAREAVEMIEQGHPEATALAREVMANRLDAATDRLYDPASSTRDAVAAAYDSAVIEAEAQDQGWLQAEG